MRVSIARIDAKLANHVAPPQGTAAIFPNEPADNEVAKFDGGHGLQMDKGVHAVHRQGPLSGRGRAKIHKLSDGLTDMHGAGTTARASG
jgi:hypothetical protein